MRAVVDRHISAEGAGDVAGAVAVYTEDVEHDVVGFPNSPSIGKQGAREFYTYLTANFRAEHHTVLHEYASSHALILDQTMTGTVIGSMLGLPGNGRQITFRILHVFEFRDELISRENVWLDSAAIADQLT
jgi:steroid delta-isomerase-like uncharacterized protein